ncbi:interleukin enhancer-binding factor 2 [Clonorchis sinensis]|uniref:Interleukin enhancer-binding factor 2 n=1 Tax=Clonorchis sinensis TaxID=79923 RepID=H2KUF3_CLOSI|nr:interleukin enhancer-binding factor 2 [Clonorchis sinensis]
MRLLMFRYRKAFKICGIRQVVGRMRTQGYTQGHTSKIVYAVASELVPGKAITAAMLSTLLDNICILPMSTRGPRNFRQRGTQNAPFVVQLPFDLTIYEPQLVNALEDGAFTECLLSYHESLMPSSGEQQALTTLVNRICEIVDGAIISPTGPLAGQIEEIRPVGSFKLGTMLAGHNTADVVIVTRILPTGELLKGIHSLVERKLASPNPAEPVRVSVQYYGFSVTVGPSIVRVFVTTTPSNIAKVDADIHINPSTQKTALAALRHTRWLDDNVSHTAVKVLIRIIKDFRRRFKAFQYLNSWMINLLALHVVVQNPSHQPLPVNQAFRRFLQLLSSGMLLPGSAGVIDPCEPGSLRLHTTMTLAEQDELCCAAQTLLRALLHGAYEILFTFDECAEDASCDQFLRLASEKSAVEIKWSEHVVTPQDEATNGVDSTLDAPKAITVA